MGKKKQVDINGAPLQAVTIGEIKTSKYGWIGTLLLFSLFIGIVYFLPEISKLYQEYFGGSTVPSATPPTNNTTNETNTTDDPEDIGNAPIYKFDKDVSVTVEDLIFSDIVLAEDGLSFKITNQSEDAVDIEKINLYIETYDTNTKEKQILNTIALDGLLTSGDSNSYSFAIETEAQFFSIKEILEEDYTYIILEPGENGIATLTCEKENDKISYYFIDNKLVEFNHVATLMKDDINYDNQYAEYYNLLTKYNSIAGATPRIRSYADYIVFTMQIDYNFFGITLDNDYYFAKDSSPRVVNFKMQSKLFDCK